MSSSDPTRFYDPKKINKWFFGTSFVFLASIIMMLLMDFVRPWKAIQEGFMAVNLKKVEANIKEANEKLNKEALDSAHKVLAEKEAALADKRSEVRALEKSINLIRGEWERANQNFRHTKALFDVVKYDYEVLHHEHPEAAHTKAKHHELEKLTEKLNHLQGLDEVAKAKLDAEEAKLLALNTEVDAARGDVAAITKEIAVLEKKRASLDDPLFFFRNGPLTDFIDPTIKVQQIVLEQIRYDNNFTTVARVDRCQTCHTVIDQKGFEEQPNPWKTHPNLDVYLSAKSPHPINDIGCTVCHSGQGESVDFKYAAHTPRDEEQGKSWAQPVKVMWNKELKKIVNSRLCLSDAYKETESCKEFLAKDTPGGYGWERLHYWDAPQLPLQYVESRCSSCHDSERFVVKAPKHNEAMRTLFTYSCYGCHKIQQLGNLEKPAPSLRRMKGKLSKEWVTKWVYNPWDFNPKTRMPKFFGLENYSLNEREVAYQKEEAIALVNYLWTLSDDYKPAPTGLGRGNIENGKKLVGEIGCLGCHASDDHTTAENLFAPHLNALGSKLNRPWLVEWLKNPRKYHPETKMPSMRLTDQETADIADYLLSKRNDAFDKLPSMVSEKTARDEVLAQYLLATLSPEAAKAKVESMSEADRDLELGKQSFNRYGCWGCHDIKGFETTPGIGAELTKEGSKILSKFDFGLHHEIPHTRDAWISAKITKPRQFDDGRILKWTDRLRMPQFAWREGDVQKLTHAVISFFDNSAIPKQSKKVLHGSKAQIEAGRRMIHDKNCVGCHNFIPEGLGGDILAHYEDKSQGPPRFNLQGEKVHPEWFKRFLVNVKPIRPWLKVRMPSFHWTNDELSTVIGYFNAQDNQSFPWYEDKARRLSSSEMSEAEQLFKELACTSCHVLGAIPPGTDVSALAPNLRLAKKRLRVSWVQKWLKAPAKIIDDTRMPAFWYLEDESNPNSKLVSPFPKYFGGDAEKQIEMLAHYLYSIGYDDDGLGGASTAPSAPAAPAATGDKTSEFIPVKSEEIPSEQSPSTITQTE